MKVTIFGATGKTGNYLIDEGLKRGFEVTVFARSGSAFEHPMVRIVRGELTDAALLGQAIRGSDAVLSALGPTSPQHPKGLPITAATQAIVAAMKQENVKRLIAVSTGTAPDPDDGFDWKVRLQALMVKVLLPSSYRDIIGLAGAIRASQLDWTMVRVALLTSRPATRRLTVGMYGHARHSMTVSREDMAIFMFNQISSREVVNNEHLNQAPGISAA
ncbi:NAD(P)-dependent oxidoreductase [Lysobacter capsici]|uniref:NAD(P)-dependent oxidoreductase n=1 Tax=Lysobacter capsici TaxID=435897 RepID=UPI001C006FAF|nr:NAD(P)H-binding protein [Lysobacter capsici]QWF16977.1 NAD(P)H-binding protein [Lysobacter capsici]